ncbi:MAG: CHAT domain-containing tetratricopeptide repeat protein [Bacteroidota bacterium]
MKRNLFDSLLYHKDIEVSKVATESYAMAMQQLSATAQFDDALIYGQRALKSKVLSPDKRCNILNKLADICYRIGEYDHGISLAKQAIDAANKYKVEDAKSVIFKSYQAMGLIAIEQSKYELAQKYLLYSLKVLGGKSDDPYTNLMAVGNMAVLHYKFSNYDSSRFYYNRALDALTLFKDQGLEYRVPFIRSQIYNNLSGVYLMERNFKQSYEYLRKVYDFLLTKYPADNALIVEVEIKLGSVLTETDLIDSAKYFLNKAKSSSLKSDNGRSRFAAEVYYHLGKYHSRKEEFQESIIYYDSSLYHNGRYGSDSNRFYDKVRLAVIALEKRLEAYKETASVDLFEKYLDLTFNEIKELSQGEYPFLTSPELIASVKKLSSDIVLGYQSLMKDENESKYIHKIITMMEVNKSVKLYAQKNYSAALNQLPQTIRETDKNLRDSLKMYAGQIDSEVSDSMILILSSKLDLLKEQVKKEYPKIFQYKYGGTNYSLEEIQNRLLPHTTLLSFMLSDSVLHILTISNSSEKISSFPLKEGGYEDLVEEVIASQRKADIQNLIVIPDGVIWKLNFDLLKSPFGQSRYLIEDVNIVYGFSLESVFSEPEQRKEFDGEVLAFSYGEESDVAGGQLSMELFRDESLNKLPGSLLEIREISQILNGNYYYGQAASEQLFKEESQNYRILHLAIHGDLSFDSEGLVFFSDGEQEDGRLHLEELYLMDLDAELAVLSACNTGTGQITSNEGIMSLGRAFAYAGVPGLVLSRSEVSDLSTPYIMKFFYQELKAGKRKSEALRNAKNRFLQEVADEHTSDPFYWSSFYVLGDDSPIYEEENSALTHSFLIAGLLIAGFIIYRLRKSAA